MEQLEQSILTALQTKFEGVDAKILGGTARKLARTVTSEGEVQTAVDGVTLQQLLESYGDSRATGATQTAVANYEKKHGLKDGRPVGEAGQQARTEAHQQGAGEPGGEVPAYVRELLESNRKLAERLDALDRERTVKTRLDTFREAVSKAPETVRTRYEKDFSRLTFKDDADFTAYLEEIAPDIEKMAAEEAQRGGRVTKPLTGGGEGGTVSPYVQARIDSQTAATAVPAIQGLPTSTK